MKRFFFMLLCLSVGMAYASDLHESVGIVQAEYNANEKDSTTTLPKSSHSVYAAHFGHHMSVRLEYRYSFGCAHQAEVKWENSYQNFVYGTDFRLLLDRYETPQRETYNVVSFGLGGHIGAQVPLHMGRFYAIPRIVVSPFISPLSFARFNSGTASGMVAGFPISVGNDFCFPVGRSMISLGVHYVYDLSLYRSNTVDKPLLNGNRTMLSEGASINLLGMSSLAVSLSVAW